MSVDTIYELIGGRSTIQAAVDLFYQKVQSDPSMKVFFNGADMSHLRAGQNMFLSMLLGGKTVYAGKAIGAAHAGPRAAGMTDAHFDTFLVHFRSSLQAVGVEAAAIEKVLAQIETTRGRVLGRVSSGG